MTRQLLRNVHLVSIPEVLARSRSKSGKSCALLAGDSQETIQSGSDRVGCRSCRPSRSRGKAGAAAVARSLDDRQKSSEARLDCRDQLRMEKCRALNRATV